MKRKNYSKELKVKAIPATLKGRQTANPLDNRTLRDLTLCFPSTCFLCTSKERFHPDLKDTISYHLFVFLHKPVDSDELYYFLKWIRDARAETREPPPVEHA